MPLMNNSEVTAFNTPNTEKLSDPKLHKLVWNTVRRSNPGRGFSDHDLEDIVQDAFANALQAIDTFREESLLSTWVVRIALNLLLTAQRKRTSKSGRLIRSVGDFDGIEPESREAPPDRGGEPSDANKLVYETIAKLPPDQQEVVQLQLEKEFTYGQIAQELGQRVTQVRGRMHRAFVRMRKIITASRAKVS
jgi:RNA polymerase sigma-70 factor (ECF subfamily)